MTDSYASQNINKEDLNDVIAHLAEDRAPMFRVFPKMKATGVLHEWVEDKLRDSRENAQIEGKNFVYADTGNESRRQNYTQIMDAEYSVTGTQQAAGKVGSKDQLKRNLKNSMKEVARDAEKAAAGIEAGSAGTGGTSPTARKMTSLSQQVADNNKIDATTLGSTVFTEDAFNDLLELVYENASPDSAFVGGKLKRAISKFTLSQGRFTKIIDGELPSYVDTYDSDYGKISIYLNPEMDNGDVYVTKKDMNEWAFLRNFHIVPGLAKTADADFGVVLGEGCACLRNSYAGAFGTGYTTA